MRADQCPLTFQETKKMVAVWPPPRLLPIQNKVIFAHCARINKLTMSPFPAATTYAVVRAESVRVALIFSQKLQGVPFAEA